MTAHELALSEGRSFTEDAGMLFHYKLGSVAVLEGKTYNIKLTNPTDLIIGEEIYKEFFGGKQ